VKRWAGLGLVYLETVHRCKLMVPGQGEEIVSLATVPCRKEEDCLLFLRVGKTEAPESRHLYLDSFPFTGWCGWAS
jgi:hypothetical protein